MFSGHIVPLALLSTVVSSAALDDAVQRRQVNTVDPYAPNNLSPCPSGSLVRVASGVNPSETAWLNARLQKATPALQSWLAKTAGFPTLSAAQYPTLGLVDGGGGFRGFLISAGVHQAFDIKEPVKHSTSGLYQAMSYETALSGSAALLASYAGNNWPLTSTLAATLWEPALQSGLTSPDDGNPEALANITSDAAAKLAAGYEIGVVDPFARLLAYMILEGPDAGINKTLSGIATNSGFRSHSQPFPIMTSIGIENDADGCGLPPLNGTQYEFNPFEFGSWEAGIANFMQSKYIGTHMQGGSPPANLTCTTGFDNLGWVVGTSTDTLNQECQSERRAGNSIFSNALLAFLDPLVQNLLGTGNTPRYSLMPNPFLGLSSAPLVEDEANLVLVDGGETLQVPPIWPLLYRDVDVIFVSDNSADFPTNDPGRGNQFLPNGRQIYHTYQQAQANGLAHRMPVIPPPATFEKHNLNHGPVAFFGCNEPASSDAMTIIYLPNRIISYNSSQNADRLQYDTADTQGMIANGVAIATNNGQSGFATCLGCAVMKRAAAKAGKALPSACAACFSKYCYN